jgi:hypothetical protein
MRHSFSTPAHSVPDQLEMDMYFLKNMLMPKRFHTVELAAWVDEEGCDAAAAGDVETLSWALSEHPLHDQGIFTDLYWNALAISIENRQMATAREVYQRLPEQTVEWLDENYEIDPEVIARWNAAIEGVMESLFEPNHVTGALTQQVIDAWADIEQEMGWG